MLENRPIMCAVIGYIIGIIMGLYCKNSIVFLYLILIPICLSVKNTQKRKFKLISFKRYFRYVKIIITGKALKIIIVFSIISNSIVLYQNNKYENLYKGLDGQKITVTGKVISNPKEKNNKYVYKLKTDYKNTYLYVNVKKNSNIELEYGSKITLEGEFKEPETRRNYKGFDYKEYLKTLKIYGTVNLDTIKNKTGAKKSIFTLSNKVFLKIKEMIQANFSDKIGNVLLGITIGYTDNIDDEIKEDFRDSNISHILAISGMHIGYITICTKFILEKLIGKRKSKIGTCIVIIIYMFITGFSPSVVRAGIMAIISMLSGIFYRKSDTWENLSLSLLILLIYNPFLIKSASVLLSFAGTIGIIVLQKNIKSITLSATLFIMPIMAVCFNQVAISSLIISVITGAIIGPIIILGFGFIVSFGLLKNRLYISVLSFGVQLLINIASMGKKLPLNKIYVITPNVLEISIYYLLILIREFFIFSLSREKFKSFLYKS